MARRLRSTEAGFYHVASRAPAGEELFRDEHDYLRFEMALGQVVDKGGVRCLAACALTTHYHLLVETADGVLPAAMKWLNQAYACAYNARYGRRGHAFADRYLSVPVKRDEQLLAAYRYVVRNPVEAGLCRRPDEWLWGSYPAAVGRGERFAFADAAFMVRCCDGSLAVLKQFVESDSGV